MKDRWQELESSACSNAYRATGEKPLQGSDLWGTLLWSQSKLQSSAALICRADVLGEMTPNAEQQDPNSNGLCSWTSNTSNARQKKQNCLYKTTLLHWCGEHYHDTVFNTDICSSPGSFRQKKSIIVSLGRADLEIERTQNFIQMKEFGFFFPRS